MKDDKLISIAMTAFNGGQFIQRALESFLLQDYENFEIIIVDNDSSDNTPEICREYTAKDKRIKFCPNGANYGPNYSSMKALNLCYGNYMVFASDHDIYAPGFLSTLIKEHENDPSIVLSYSRTALIDVNDKLLEIAPDILDTRGMNRIDRFRSIIWGITWGNMICGLFKTDAARKIWKTHNVIGPDHVLLADLSLLGSVAQVNQPLYFRRRQRPVEPAEKAQERMVEWFMKSGPEKLVPWTLMAYEHIKIVTEAEIDDAEKDILYDEIIKCFPVRFRTSFEKEASVFMEKYIPYLKKETMNNSQMIRKIEINRLLSIIELFSRA